VQKAFREIARHRNATSAALLRCLDDRQARPIAAGHPALDVDVLLGLVQDADPRVVEAAAANPALPRFVMAAHLTRSDFPMIHGPE
jgi:hypothetical protein